MKHEYKSFAPDLTEPSPLGLDWHWDVSRPHRTVLGVLAAGDAK